MAKKQYSRIGIALLSASLLASSPARGEDLSASAAANIYQEKTTYSIFRKGKNIGKHVLKITSVDNRIDVAVDSRITVRVLKIPVFKFRYLSKEVWEYDRLIKVESTTTTDKKVEQASLKNTDNQSQLFYNGTLSKTELLQYPTNHWNIGAVKQSSLYNTVKGVKSNVKVDSLGIDTLTIGDKTIDATHYAYSGDIIAETWYDKNNRWVKLAFLGSDGNQITYLIDNP